MIVHGCSVLPTLTRLISSSLQKKSSGLYGRAWSSLSIASRSSVMNVKSDMMKLVTTMVYVLMRNVIAMKIILVSSVNFLDLVMSLDVSGTYCIFQSHRNLAISFRAHNSILYIIITAEKDVSTELKLLGDPNDDEVDFVEVYGRPVYVLRNLSGKPTSLMRLGYSEDETDQYYSVEYPPNGTETLPLHQHYNEQFFEDDDFFEINNQTEDFQKLMNNYTFALSFTGRRWYGKLLSPDRYSGNFKEEEYHAFWDNAFSGLGDQDNSTLLISAPTTKGSPVGVDFYEMRRRNVALESGIYDYDYSPFGVLIPLVEYEGSGFFHCNKPNV
jgi:hypothetical protein